MIPEPPPNPKRPRKAWKTTVVVLGVVLALCCLGGTAVVGFIGYDLHQQPAAEAEIREFAEDLIGHLERGEHDAVYEALSAGARGRYSLEIFARRLADHPKPSGHRIDHISAWLLLTYVTIDLLYPDGHGARTFDLVKEHDRWRVDSDLLHDLDSGPRHGGGGHHD